MPEERPAIEIVDYRPALAADFARLNREWIERDFGLEPVDEAVFADPQGTILAGGGTILFALAGDVVLGTCALKREGQRYELTKMTVAPSARGMGVGRVLVEAVIARFKLLGGDELWLETAHMLKPAIRLYESAGFVRAPAPRPSEYRRTEIYMRYQGA